MKSLGNLKPAKGSNIKNKRLGRGIGSGLGKTAGKGHKGQRARKSGNVRSGFEGGQMPIYRHLPKRGFVNINRQEYNIINLRDLNIFENNTKITPALLEKNLLLKDPKLPIKLLGQGKLEKTFVILVNKTSVSAKAAVEKVGGKIEEI